MDFANNYLIPVLTLTVCVFAFIRAVIGSVPSKAKALVIVGAVVNIVATVGSLAFFRLVMPKWDHDGDVLLVVKSAWFVTALLHTAGLLCFVLAAFADRKPRVTDRDDRDDRDDDRPRRATRRYE